MQPDEGRTPGDADFSLVSEGTLPKTGDQQSRREVVHSALSRFKRGELLSGNGAIVTQRKQAVAIALATAKRQAGGPAEDPPARGVAASGQLLLFRTEASMEPLVVLQLRSTQQE